MYLVGRTSVVHLPAKFRYMLRNFSLRCHNRATASGYLLHLRRWKSSTVGSLPEPGNQISSEGPSKPNHDEPSEPFPPLPSTTSSSHSSLSTFLAHARQTGLSPTSTTYVGTYYEYLCQHSLRRLGFSLTRTGGRSDAGVDLIGYWQLPSLPYPLRCIVQCKNLKAKAGPNLIRELEGAFVGAPSGWRGESTVGVLCAGREATKGVREAIRGARKGLVWVMIEDVGEMNGVGAQDDDYRSNELGRIRQILWNERTAGLGAEGVGVQVKYLPPQVDGKVAKEAILMWENEVWEPELENQT